ncbi:MAG: wax ester/triacylglycerol synthase family O-acyltransferase [Frankiaceae bacterium]|nr:wax ester/triacylglycerol synthase family O-acyltransferase [Frankiaceae bacterium]
MALMSPLDAAFLLPETRDQPMHVGSLQLYTKPSGAGKDFLQDAFQALLEVDEIAPLFRKRAYRSWSTAGQWAWQEDTDIDLEHHVRHSALPRPGRIRELLALASRLHSTLLDRQRPLWEMHLIEGLNDDRFAVYFKVHHAMLDGVSGLRLMQAVLSKDPDDTTLRAPYMPYEPKRRSEGGSSPIAALGGLAKGALDEVMALGPGLMRAGEKLIREQAAALPIQAPRTILNGSITGSRRFAAESWPLDRLKAVGAASGASLNDVVLAMCSGALRLYLQELAALPDSPLIAMVPVSLRGVNSEQTSGNNVGSILCNLATDEPDPAARLAKIQESMNDGKAAMAAMSPLQVMAVSAVSMAPIALGTMYGVHKLLPPPFNVTISNVPGPRQKLYMGGATLDEFYPLSIPTVGQALNITVTSYVDRMDFGLTGCRRNVPHLQRLLTHLETSLGALEMSQAA